MDDFESATNKASAEKGGKASCLLTQQELFNKKVQAVTVKLVKQLNREAVAVKMKLLSLSQVLHQVVFNCVA